jgi:hypothetical protein
LQARQQIQVEMRRVFLAHRRRRPCWMMDHESASLVGSPGSFWRIRGIDILPPERGPPFPVEFSFPGKPYRRCRRQTLPRRVRPRRRGRDPDRAVHRAPNRCAPSSLDRRRAAPRRLPQARWPARSQRETRDLVLRTIE